MIKRLAAVAAAMMGLLVAPHPSLAADQWALEQVSVTPAGANFPGFAPLQGLSADGRHVLFYTSEPLVPEDQTYLDLYDRHDGTTELISVGPSGSGYNGPHALFAVSPDGERVIFETVEGLVPEDTNGMGSLYQRYRGTTTMIAEDFWGYVIGVSEDASLVYFTLYRQEGGVTYQDLYRWDGTTASLIPWPGTILGFSRDLTRIYFRSPEQLDPADTDSCVDLYLSSGGTVSLISGPAYPPETCVNGADFRFEGESVDGQHVFFTTTKWIDPVYGHGTASDYFLYEHFNGQNEPLVRAYDYGQTTFNGVSDDGRVVVLTTAAQLVPEDTDQLANLYKRENGQFELIPGAYRGISRGGRIFFVTSSQLVPEDADTTPDIYMRDGSYTELITSNVVWDNRGYGFVGVSRDGGRAFFSGFENSYRCLFSHPIYSNTSTNTGLCAPNSEGPSWRISADGSRAAFDTAIALLASDTDSAKDVYAANLMPPTGYARPRGASPIRVSLVPAYSACTAPNRTHGGPLAFPSCAPPAQAGTSLTIGVGDGTPPSAKSLGSMKIVVHPNAPADVELALNITNVYNRADLTDYTGELEGRLSMRLTDRPTNGAQTTEDFPFSFTAPCAATADTTLGAACAVNTTAEAVLPGTITSGERAIWALDQVRVYDGGSDGDADTKADNQLFEVQGVFVP